MIIVIGSVRAKPETFDELLAMSLEHVHRSRREPGCIMHSVNRDAEDPLRLIFLEYWEDKDALDAHFRVPASGEFVNAASALAGAPPEMTIYTAEQMST